MIVPALVELPAPQMETVVEWVNNEDVSLAISPLTVSDGVISADLLVEKEGKMVSLENFFGETAPNIPVADQPTQELPIPGVQIEPTQALQYYTMGGMISVGSFALKGFQQDHEDILIRISEELKQWFDESQK